MLKRRASHRPYEIFLIAGVFFSAVMVWLLSHGYQSDYSLRIWAKILAFGANDFRLEDSSILFPYIPFNLFWTASAIPGLHSEYTSYLISVLVGAGVFAHWNLFLVKKGYKIKVRLLLIGLVICHPFILWGTTSGLNNALAFAAFYMFCFGVTRLVLIHDIHSILFVGGALTLFFLTDDRAMYVAIVMFPFIPLIAPERMLKESLSSVYVILLMPVVFAFLCWMYLNWMFHNDMFMFMHAPEAMFNGVWQTSDQYSWLNQWGGEWVATIGYTILLSAISVPVTIWIIWNFRKHERVLHTVPKLFLIPAVSAGIGTVGFALFHAVDVLYFQIAVFMASLMLIRKLHGKMLNIVVALLLVGNIGGWWVMETNEAPQIDTWQMSFTKNASDSKSDVALAKFLNDQPHSTLIDQRAAYRVIAAKDNVENLVFPFQIEVKMMDKYYLDTIDQFATINPKHSRSVLDGVGKRFEGIYWGGLPGYHLVYDDQQWRVYRRNDYEKIPVAAK